MTVENRLMFMDFDGIFEVIKPFWIVVLVRNLKFRQRSIRLEKIENTFGTCCPFCGIKSNNSWVLANQNSYFINNPENGNYAVEVTTAYGCTILSAVSIVNDRAYVIN